MLAAFARHIFAHPQKTFAVLVFSSGAIAITANALAFQKMRHPAPLFNDKIMAQGTGPVPFQTMPQAPVPPVPPVRPVEVIAAAPAYPVTARSASLREAPVRDAIADMLKVDPAAQTGSNKTIDLKLDQTKTQDQSKTMAAAQRALIKLGYGPLSTDGKSGPETRRAIERFEKDHRLPVTGELNGRVTRELVVQIGE
jgi:hypothetical protein